MTPCAAFLDAFLDLPDGTFTGRSGGRRYVVSRTSFAGGCSHKLIAHELGGPDYISMNLYQTTRSGALLKPCEMPAEKVIAFVIGLEPEA